MNQVTTFFQGSDVLSTRQVTRDGLEYLFTDTDNLRRQIEKEGMSKEGAGSLLATVFLEPSTRTRLSFQFAMVKIGGQVVDFGLAEAASIQKGETFEDTMRMVDGYSPNVIVVRSPVVGSAQTAANICHTPVINAGDGSNEHPTQAMLDVYTIRRIRGSVDGLRIGMMGDLAHSRTTSSLSYALDKYDNVDICYIAPDELQVKKEVTESLKHSACHKLESYESVIESLDFLYVTRLQKERFSNPKEYERFKGSYQLNKSALSRYGKLPYLMHPLPRVDELSPDLDGLPVAKYFEEAQNGMFVRAALLKEVILG